MSLARRQRAQRAGRWAETACVAVLRRKGYRVLARRGRAPVGEIDIIAREEETLVFVEVKTRSTVSFGMPQEAVDRRKQRQLIRTAQAYLNEKGGALPLCRFDVVTVRTDRKGRQKEFVLIRGAFDATEF